MIYYFHLFLDVAMAVFFWSRVYYTFQRRRIDPQERKIDLIIYAILALLFTVASIDLFTTIPQIVNLLGKIELLVNNTGG